MQNSLFFLYHFAVNQHKLSSQLQNTFNSYYRLHQSVNNLQDIKRRQRWLSKLDCIDDVTCDVIISYSCHASFNSDKNVSHNDSALSATNSDIYNKEIRQKCCSKRFYIGLTKVAFFDENFDEISFL